MVSLNGARSVFHIATHPGHLSQGQRKTVGFPIKHTSASSHVLFKYLGREEVASRARKLTHTKTNLQKRVKQLEATLEKAIKTINS